MKRTTTELPIPAISIGTRSKIVIHDYFPSVEVANMDRDSLEWYSQERIYIQASLHADELPGLLVAHHLIKLLDVAAEKGMIRKQITIVPYANPLGLGQIVHGKHFGRFSLLSGTNFNRSWPDVSEVVGKRIENELKEGEKHVKENSAIIRRALYEEASKISSNKPEAIWKRELYKRACVSSVVLDLHCDSDAVMHIYTHDRLWPQMADLATAIESKCNMIAPESGGNPFDEAYSCPWANMIDKYPSFPIEMGCHSATIELRGEHEVSDELASRDAHNLYRFLVHRGFVEDSGAEPLVDVSAQVGVPLTGVDMIESTAPGVLAWKVRSGDVVEKGQLLGEIVDIEDVDAPRIPIHSKTAGIIFGMHSHKLAVPGDIVIKVAGAEKLDWRTGNLLTAK